MAEPRFGQLLTAGLAWWSVGGIVVPDEEMSDTGQCVVSQRGSGRDVIEMSEV